MGLDAGNGMPPPSVEHGPKSKYGKRDVPLMDGMVRKLWAARAAKGVFRGDDDLVLLGRDGQPLD